MVAEGASLGNGISLGPGCIIYPGVTIESDVTIGPGAIIGSDPEIRDWAGASPQERVRIGSRSVIGPRAVISGGSSKRTSIAADVMVMSGVTVGHDVQLEFGVTVSAGAQIGGFAVIEPLANLGLGTTVHQFACVGFGSMVGMGSAVRGSIGYFQTFAGNPIRLVGRNTRLQKKLGMDSLPDPFSKESLVQSLESTTIHQTNIRDYFHKQAPK